MRNSCALGGDLPTFARPTWVASSPKPAAFRESQSFPMGGSRPTARSLWRRASRLQSFLFARSHRNLVRVDRRSTFRPFSSRDTLLMFASWSTLVFALIQPACSTRFARYTDAFSPPPMNRHRVHRTLKYSASVVSRREEF